MFHRWLEGQVAERAQRVVIAPAEGHVAVRTSLPAVLTLADGSVFEGRSVGAAGLSSGEAVFNTAMTGYQEVVTDPSYARQLVVLTQPHVGNTGCTDADDESTGVAAAGLIVRDVPRQASNWRSKSDLPNWLRARGVIAIADVDTRKLTRLLRERGSQGGTLWAAASERDTPDLAALLASARAFPGLTGMDLAKGVSTGTPYVWREGSLDIAGRALACPEPKHHVVVYDFGVKRTILRRLVDQGCRVTVVPAGTSARDAMALAPDGVLLSNGPGDPSACGYAIAAVRELVAARIPTFGVCLGHQLLALAVGARTSKMKFGHHGTNHPVQDLDTGRVMLTSQNHGFAVDEATLPASVRVTHRSLFDGSNQGIALRDAPAFGFQGHPEAAPGPHDLSSLFDRFVTLMGAR